MRSSLREQLFDNRFLSDEHKLIEAPFSNSARMDYCDARTEMMDPLINLWVEERYKRMRFSRLISSRRIAKQLYLIDSSLRQTQRENTHTKCF